MKRANPDREVQSLILLSRRQQDDRMFKKTLKVVMVCFALSFLLEFMPYSFEMLARR
jgi:hypothetical protein